MRVLKHTKMLFQLCVHNITVIIPYALSTDAPFQAKYLLHALRPLPHSSPAYTMLKLTEQAEFEEYLRENPNAFSWKTVAEVLYRCGEEKHLDTLFTYMKSPEGNFIIHIPIFIE